MIPSGNRVPESAYSLACSKHGHGERDDAYAEVRSGLAPSVPTIMGGCPAIVGTEGPRALPHTLEPKPREPLGLRDPGSNPADIVGHVAVR